jgi:hypothetical protein
VAGLGYYITRLDAGGAVSVMNPLRRLWPANRSGSRPAAVAVPCAGIYPLVVGDKPGAVSPLTNFISALVANQTA